MKSMTSYGYAEYSCDKFIMTMELKSYNNRFLEVNYTAPSYLSTYEVQITDLIKQKAQRGHIDLSIKVKNLQGKLEVGIDENVATAYMEAYKKLSELAKKNHLKMANSSLSSLADQDGVLSVIHENGMQEYMDGLDYCAKEVLSQFEEGKIREGNATKKDLSEKIDSIAESVRKVSAKADELESTIKKNLDERVHEMLKDTDYDEGRILTEVAVMAMRYTINEELVRLSTHMTEFRRLLESDEPVGKRMDFLCQEMNREINTIGSKSVMVEINLEVVNMKDCLENIREQIRNIE